MARCLYRGTSQTLALVSLLSFTRLRVPGDAGGGEPIKWKASAATSKEDRVDAGKANSENGLALGAHRTQCHNGLHAYQPKRMCGSTLFSGRGADAGEVKGEGAEAPAAYAVQ